MNIRLLDRKRILISLCRDDIEAYRLGFDDLSLSDERSYRMLRELIQKASAATGISIENKKISVEVMQNTHGWLMVLTLLPKGSGRRVYRIKRLNDMLTLGFDELDAFLGCVLALYMLRDGKIRSSAYRCNGKYFLVISSSSVIRNSIRNTASEFSSDRYSGKAFAAYIVEHGRALASGRAIETIGIPMLR